MHEWLRAYLKEMGYTVYPSEIVVGLKGLIHPNDNFVLDVAARKHPFLYAFEYKSSGDSLYRAFKQIQNYRLSFDFVIVVAEFPRQDITSKTIPRLKKLGAGMWKVEGDEHPYKFEVLLEPIQQNPIVENHLHMERKFKRYCKLPKLSRYAFSPSQKKLEMFSQK